MDRNEMFKKLLSKKLVHPFPDHMRIGRECASEGLVLLKNDNNALPITQEKIALFGAGATDTVTCGTGSGHASAPYTVNIKEGFENAGLVLTSKKWLSRFLVETKKANDDDTTLSLRQRVWSGHRIMIDDLPITDNELEEAKKADVAVYVIRRTAGEGKDRVAEPGDYYLNSVEISNLRLLGEHFKHTIVVLNSNIIDANFINEIPGLDALMLMGFAGNEAGNALADVLTGKICPSGHLTDTWAKNYLDYPASKIFGNNDGDSLQENYEEDIYVGYRYFNTFDIEPIFPFGYGLSYTDFEHTLQSYGVNWTRISIEMNVTNTGKVDGKEVVQIYALSPKGRLHKVYQELIGFKKTRLLKPGESQTLFFEIPIENLSSYDEVKAAFIMEPGVYLIRFGTNSRDTSEAFAINLDEEAVIRQVHNQMSLDRKLNIIKNTGNKDISFECEKLYLTAKECNTVEGANKIERVTTTYIAEENQGKFVKNNSYKMPFETKEVFELIEADFNSTLIDVVEGRVSMEAFVSSLHPEVLCRIVAGISQETSFDVDNRMKYKVEQVPFKKSSGSTTSMFLKTLGIPGCNMTDGPAGLHLLGEGTTSYPVGVVLAQTWNEDYCQQIGETMGIELDHYNYSVILGPGMNIHRDPLCGRNFEYFSEDPLLTGKIAAAITKGVQKIPGSQVSIKHFACNNQEADRRRSNSTVSERALREIYLRGFEICVREAQPATIMTSYNKINGVQTSSNYELLTEILRGEWGFNGLVLTDWGTDSKKPYDLHAGNDLIMGGYRSKFLMDALNGADPEFTEDGAVKIEEFEVYGGFGFEKIESWNSFEPDSNGEDTVSAIVKEGIEINERVKDYVNQGIAKIEKCSDGQKVVYKGTNRGAYLMLGDLQKSAINVLKSVVRSSAYMDMMGTVKK